MADISVLQAREIFTQTRIDVFKERVKVMSFLRSFFPDVIGNSKYLTLDVQRGTEKVAVDIFRGTEGNRNSVSKSSWKGFLPPYFREFIDATEIDLYDRLFSESGIISGTDLAAFITAVNDEMNLLVDKIERAYELQCAQVLSTGIVSLNSGDNIDFKRKAESMVDLMTGNYWDTGSVDPRVALQAGGDFLRQVGKAQGGVLNVLLGSEVLSVLLNNDTFKASSDLKNISLGEIHMPQRNSLGATLHGRVSAGTYICNLWAYPEVYDNTSGVSTPYIAPKEVIMLPEIPRFKMGFAAVPQLLKSGGTRNVRGNYVFNDFTDERSSTHIFDVKSAGVAIPVAVDQIYTFRAKA